MALSIVLLSQVPLADATLLPYDIRTFVSVGSPSISSSCDMFGCTNSFQMTFRNNSNGTVEGVAYFVFHNSMGQTVYFDKTNVSSSASQSTSATHPLSVPNSKDVSVFVVSQGGIALSNTTVVHP